MLFISDRIEVLNVLTPGVIIGIIFLEVGSHWCIFGIMIEVIMIVNHIYITAAQFGSPPEPAWGPSLKLTQSSLVSSFSHIVAFPAKHTTTAPCELT